MRAANGRRKRTMKIGVMLRHVSQLGGMGNYTRQLIAALLENDGANEYVMYYGSTRGTRSLRRREGCRAGGHGQIEAAVGSLGDAQTGRSGPRGSHLQPQAVGAASVTGAERLRASWT
jgi:hypothetical protein